MLLRLSGRGHVKVVPFVLFLVMMWWVSVTSSARAAQRCVLVEEFTATWCQYCPTVGTWVSQLQDLYPETLALLQEHVSEYDVYAIQWGKDRFLSYGGGGIPVGWFDGVTRVGGITGGYDAYLNAYLARAAGPTDVTLELGGIPVEGPTYAFQARVGLEAGGTPKLVRLYVIRALDHYPLPTNVFDRNCLMEAAAFEDISLQPGQMRTIERTLTFDTTSWAQPENIRVLAWVQAPGSSGPREVFQARQIAWPIQPLPSLYPLGDLNCDGEVNFADINPFVLALGGYDGYHADFPNCDMNLADCNGDGTVDFGDINPFVDLLNGSL